MDIAQTIATELSVKSSQVHAAIELLDGGATVPFIARYRKEVTGGLDDTQLRQLEERLGYLRELEERRGVVLKSIEEQGKLSDDLRRAILEADSKVRLEDLYAPYKPKRRTKAQLAREAGLDALLDELLQRPKAALNDIANKHLNPDKNYPDVDKALEGARYIFMERAAENAELVGRLRGYSWAHGKITASVVPGKEEAGKKFSDYFDHQEALAKMPSHRALALFRARNEDVLRLSLVVEGQDDVQAPSFGWCEGAIAQSFNVSSGKDDVSAWLMESVRWAWRVKLASQLETELFAQVREAAEEEAIRVFGENLRDLLLAAPAGAHVTMGLDPGLRTGVKVAVVDATGKLVANGTIYPHAPKNQWDQSIASLAALAKQFNVSLIAIGNGTASRETEKLVRDAKKRHPELKLTHMVVSEAGASVYSASELAAKEFPDLDVSIRGAVSIARRLQDPLAELVKIDPKAIGVGQYQHDVNQSHLARKLDAVVEDCVNAVGVDLNTASAALLRRIAGMTESIAQQVVAYREKHGAFTQRKDLLQVPRLGPKAFEQSAGFLRIANGSNPLDASAVHPEAYDVVTRIAKSTNKSVDALVGDSAFLRKLDPKQFVDEKFGEPTVKDILLELEKPGRDPRPEFRSATFQEGVETLADLTPGMILEGVVTNVANFGAFVDIGVHQDGLVHVSALSNTFVKDPRDVVKAGQLVRVKVLEVDQARKRISLTMRLEEAPTPKETASQRPPNREQTDRRPKQRPAPQAAPETAMAAAFSKLGALKNNDKP